jgi:co-chaperonin GroES (HSP10)
VRQDKRRGQRAPLDVEAGDPILLGNYASREAKLDGEDDLIVREHEVLAVLRPRGKTHRQ